MSRVLVTGASGFIGSHLVEALSERGDEVTCLVRKTSKVDRLRALGAVLTYGDVTDPAGLPEAVAGHEIVYHLAGLTRTLRRGDFHRVNEQGVRNVARACAAQATPPVSVVLSSLAAAGPAPRRPRIESDPPEPVSRYGRSKRAGERAAEQLADRVPTSVVRPPPVFGPRDRAGLAIFRAIARTGLHVVPGLGRMHLSLIHAADLARLLILVAERGARLELQAREAAAASQGYYFAAGDEHPTYAELGRKIGTALGRARIRIVPTLPRTVWLVAAWGELLGRLRGQPPAVGFDKAREARAGSWTCSAERAQEELDFQITTPLDERLCETAEWYRREGWL